MNSAADDFDRWIRNDFVALNTRLEEAYFAAGAQILHDRPELEAVRRRIGREGAALVGLITQSHTPRTTRESDDERYELLGSVGLYLGACRRHEIEGPQSAAWPLARALAASLGVAPRLVFAHQAIYNRAVEDSFRTFTSLEDERVFILYNALSVLAYQRTATALRRVRTLGVSSPLTAYLLREARSGLDDVLDLGRTLSKTLDVDRFFLNIRPYYKPHRVGGVEYRGVNAGDFAAINSIDVLLGLCSPYDPFYQALLTEKYPYLPPGDQEELRAVMTAEPLLDAFLRETAAGPLTPQLRDNAESFLTVCRLHGAASAFHHHRLVVPFLQAPADRARREQEPEAGDLTTSGPPLHVVMDTLARLVDLRTARRRPDTDGGARPALDRLRHALETTPGTAPGPAPAGQAALGTPRGQTAKPAALASDISSSTRAARTHATG
ncbi:tryptophan 2,3-dioxygenase KynA [Streptomyces camponoticapitis]|uniref:Tryptophan 2,3-dioxygenase KynA n=1 Tax=Streptomyces camponoticapitis TaxID=1616125 RepID=A0ABQ2E298_9ACTN|nr:monodechloroaminopyrrolnitrin synthase PrnB family protein [Streptomyces camponoticapitis]GGJ89193.1 tryptophan 2,3-dioxygenase KynA [Streptomyces camponoticapitis]